MVITFNAEDAATVAENIPWPWYAGAVAIVVGLAAWIIKLMFRPLIQAQTGQWVPRATVDMMIKTKDDELARKDADHAREIEGVRRDLADWRTAYHLAAEVSVTEAAQQREIVEGVRLMLSVVESLPLTRHNSPRPPGVIEADGTAVG